MRRYGYGSQLRNQFVEILSAECVIRPAEIVKDGDPGYIWVETAHLTSSEGEAIVKAMKMILVAPIRVRLDDDYGVFFRSAQGKRCVVIDRHRYIDQNIENDQDFVPTRLRSNASPEEKAFVDWVKRWAG